MQASLYLLDAVLLTTSVFKWFPITGYPQFDIFNLGVNSWSEWVSGLPFETKNKTKQNLWKGGSKSASNAEKDFGIITICWFASLNSKQHWRKAGERRCGLKLKQQRQLNESGSIKTREINAKSAPSIAPHLAIKVFLCYSNGGCIVAYLRKSSAKKWAK